MESLTDSEETIAELRKRHDREKKILLDDNRKLISELEMLGENTRRFQAERMQMDNDYEELRSKRQAISQWERQISEIIQWVSDEKDARSYLQALATKMTEELDYLKHTGNTEAFSVVIRQSQLANNDTLTIVVFRLNESECKR